MTGTRLKTYLASTPGFEQASPIAVWKRRIALGVGGVIYPGLDAEKDYLCG